jgi:hypothetical protein
MTTKQQKKDRSIALRSAMEAVEAAYATLARIDDEDKRTALTQGHVWFLKDELVRFLIRKYGPGAVLRLIADLIDLDDDDA